MRSFAEGGDDKLINISGPSLVSANTCAIVHLSTYGTYVVTHMNLITCREVSLEARQVICIHGNEVIITSKEGVVHRFYYDHCFWSFDESQCDFAGQTEVYRRLAQPPLDRSFEGYNTCLFAYGQVCVCVCMRAYNRAYYCVFVSAAHAEADTFFCFRSLMVEIGDHITKNLDGAHTGIGTTRVHCGTSRTVPSRRGRRLTGR